MHHQQGSEVIGMLHTLLGDRTFTRGVQTYLRDNDGKVPSSRQWCGYEVRLSSC